MGEANKLLPEGEGEPGLPDPAGEGKIPVLTSRIIGKVALPVRRRSMPDIGMALAADAKRLKDPFEAPVAVLQHAGGTGLKLVMARGRGRAS